MKALALGCSFTRGSELPDPDNQCWPSVLARMTNWSIDNHAENGGSNEMMFRKTVERAQQYQLILIAWTEAHRMEVYLNEPMRIKHRRYPEGPLSVNAHWGDKELRWPQQYYARHYNTKYYINKWLAQVVALQSYLKYHDKKYLFLSAFGTLNEIQKSPADYPLINQLDLDYWVDWPCQIVDWAHGAPIGQFGHPLEQGHCNTAEKIYEHTRRLGWIS